MRSIKNSLFFGLLLLASIHTQAQKKNVSINEAKGNQAYSLIHYADALKYYKQAHLAAKNTEEKDSLVVKIADCFWMMRNYDSAYRWYTMIPDEGLVNKKDRIRLAELSATLGAYNFASKTLSTVDGYAARSNGFKHTPQMQRDSIHWNVQYLEGINTNYFREFSPLIVDSSLIWTTNQPKRNSKNGIMGWDNMGYNRLMKVSELSKLAPTIIPGRELIDLAKIDSNRPAKLSKHYELADVDLLSVVRYPSSLWDKLKKIHGFSIPIEFKGNVKYNVAHSSYDSSSKQLFFSANLQGKLKEATRMLTVASSTMNGSLLSELKTILDSNIAYSNMHPAVHPNGRIVVFSSNRDGGVGGFDLYVIQKDEQGVWSAPVPAKGVNTIGNELFPSFGANGKFYFSSDGYPGLGGLDIYTATFQLGKVDQIRQLSYPINSPFDDFGLTVNTNGTKGYFSSDRLGTDDIFQFEQEAKPILITGKVRAEGSQENKAGIVVSILEKEESTPGVKTAAVSTVYPTLTVAEKAGVKTEIVENLGEISVEQLAAVEQVKTKVEEPIKTDASGEYRFWAKPNRKYEVTIHDGVNPDQILAVNTQNITGRIDLAPIEVKNKQPDTIVVNPEVPKHHEQKFIVYFKFDKDHIRKQYTDTLDQVVELMQNNKAIICELSGHTDQFGSEKYNDSLSKRRVDNVKEYLQKAGISADRIRPSSFGERKLIQVLSNKERSEINRRVEIQIIVE